MNFHVTVVMGKVVYGGDRAQVISYLASRLAAAKNNAVLTSEWGALLTDVTAGNRTGRFVKMSDMQFLRFKNAGKRHPSSAPKTFVDPTTGTIYSYSRVDRTGSGKLQKWDAASYKTLVGRAGPWGAGPKTNRDHLLAHSINVAAKSLGHNPYGATSTADLKGKGLAVVVSGEHHRKGSMTYGGRVQAVKMAHAMDPTTGAEAEMDSMLEYKDLGRTLRVEMVGAYVHLYARLVEEEVIDATSSTDRMLVDYLRYAVDADDNFWRINPKNVGLTKSSSVWTTSGKKWTV